MVQLEQRHIKEYIINSIIIIIISNSIVSIIIPILSELMACVSKYIHNAVGPNLKAARAKADMWKASAVG